MSDGMGRLSAALADRYRLERELGAGGMATVYLAADLKHDRKVAIKVLKPALAAVLGAERFVQEIKTTAQLQHPHILPLFDSGEAGRFLYYVMPYIRGETIREKLNRETQFGIEEAIRITIEIADALDYAHRHGVIHRDIKPENILLHDGRAMVMDFGIALAVSAAAGGRMTETGLSLGTPHYMSPEQATADRDITGRSDIYSLASVAYEMLTGEPPHTGTSALQIIMKIIAEPVARVTSLRKRVPANVAAALAKALEKLPADRFESAKAFADALANPAFTNAASAVVAARMESPRFWQLLSAGLVVTTLVSLGVALARRESPSETGTSRYRIQLGETRDQEQLPLISPSGEWLGFVQLDGPVMLRRRGTPTAVDVPGTEGAQYVAFSPDDSAIAFVGSGNALQVVALSGGAPRRLATALSPVLAWGSDGWIYFTEAGGGIARVSAAGGPTEPVAQPDSLARVYFALQLLPGGDGTLLLTIGERTNVMSVGVWDRATGRARRLGPWLRASYLPSGYLVFVDPDSALWGARFDLRRRAVASDAVLLENGLDISGDWPKMAVSSAGTLLYRVGERSGAGRLARIDRSGRVEFLPTETRGSLRGVRLSPDGRRLVFGLIGGSGTSPITVHDLSIGSSKDLVPGLDAFDPIWSLDGRRIAFHSYQSGNPDPALATIGWNGFEVAADSGGTPRRLFRREGLVAPDAWVSDGRLIVRGQPARARGTAAFRGGSDLFLVSPGGDSASVEPLLDAPWNEAMSRLSPDGRWLAYAGNPRDTTQVFVRPFPDVGSRVVQVSQRDGTAPVWSRDGRTLYYLESVRPDAATARLGSVGMNLVAARVRTALAFEVESRTVVVANLLYQRPVCCTSNYDVLPDGSGFIMAVADTGVGRPSLVLVESLLSQLRAAARR